MSEPENTLSSLLVTPFSYDRLNPEVAMQAQKAAECIRGTITRSAEHIWDAGGLLAEIKESLEHGQWVAWLDAEFSMSPSTARRYIRVYQAWPNGLRDWRGSFNALYKLSSVAVDDETRQQALELANDGKTVTVNNLVEPESPPIGDVEETESPEAVVLESPDTLRSDSGAVTPAGGKVLETPLGDLDADLPAPSDEEPDWDRDKAWKKIFNAVDRFREQCNFEDYLWLADMLQPLVDDLRLE